MADAPEGIPGGFTIDLKLLAETINTVTREKGSISTSVDAVNKDMKGLSTSWNSPAHSSFDEVRTWFEKASADIMAVLDELLLRLQTSHDNYANAENANASNVTV